MRISLAAAATLLMALSGATVAHGWTLITTTERPTTVREYAGWLAFTRYDAAADVHRLTVRAPDGVERALPIAPSDAAFDLDVGPDSAGQPQVIYSRCARQQRDDRGAVAYGRRDCDLFVFSLVRSTGERPVRNANTTDSAEMSPTLWRGRIAFARRYDGRDRPVIYTKRLIAPRERPSTRLPGIPARRSGDKVSDASVRELELYGRRLAQGVTFRAGAGPRSEVRLVDLRSKRSRRIGTTGVGIRGQSLLGLSFAQGRVGWHLTCLADPCRGTAYRYRISTRVQQRAPTLGFDFGGRATGFALIHGRRAYLAGSYADSQDGCETSPDAPPSGRRCPLVLTRPLDFTRSGG